MTGSDPFPDRLPDRLPDPVNAFLAADVSGRARLVRQREVLDAVRAAFGDAFADEYTELGEEHLAGGGHLAGRAGVNVLVVPGVMGSLLASGTYPGIWWLSLGSRHRLRQLGLTPDGLGDAFPDAAIQAVSLQPVYDRLIVKLADTDGIRPQQFPYDWRKPLAACAGLLADRIRSAYEGNGGDPVHLVAHSMGGLLVRQALRRFPDLWDAVGEVIFLGTPHHGSPAIASYLKHHLWGSPAMRLVGRYVPPPVLRSLWGVLSLLPSPADVYPGAGDADGAADGADHPCADFDLHDATAYRLADLGPDGTAALQRVLDAAAGMHRELDRWHRTELAQSRRDRMAVVAGVGVRTLFRVARRERAGLHREVVALATAVRRGDPHRDGDGRVPVASAQLPWIGETRFVRCTHTGLLSDREVLADVLRRLRGEPMTLSDTPDGAYLHLAGGGGQEALSPEPVPVAGADGDDPGYWDAGPGDEDLADGEDLDLLDARVTAGPCPDLLGVRLL